MNIKELKIGSRLELELAEFTHQKKYIYVSQLLDIADEATLVAAVPIHASRVVFIPNNTRINVFLLHSRRGLLSAVCTVKSKEHKGNIPVMYLHINEDFKSVQRRKYFRLDCLMEARYRILEDYSEDVPPAPAKDEEYRKASVKNISGSGICMVLEEEASKGCFMDVILFMGKTARVKAVCNAVRISRIRYGKATKFEAGLHFVKISEADQEAVIKYIFKQQRLLLKKDLLR